MICYNCPTWFFPPKKASLEPKDFKRGESRAQPIAWIGTCRIRHIKPQCNMLPRWCCKTPRRREGNAWSFYRQSLFENFWDLHEVEILELELSRDLCGALAFHIFRLPRSWLYELAGQPCSSRTFFTCWWWKMRKVLIPNHSRQCFGYQYLRMELVS